MRVERIGIALTAAVLLASGVAVYSQLVAATRAGVGVLSSLDTQPAGGSALFGSYARAGLSVTRGWTPDAISLQAAASTTAFVIAPATWSSTLDQNLDAFVRSGGRLVLLQVPAAALAQSLADNEVGAPRAGVRTAFERDAGADFSGGLPLHHTSAGATPVAGAAPACAGPLPLAAPASGLRLDPGWQPLYVSAGGRPVLAQRRLGQGTLVLGSTAMFLSNDNLSQDPDPILLSWLTGSRRRLFVAESPHGFQRVRGVLWLVRSWGLGTVLGLVPVLLALTAWWLAASVELPPDDQFPGAESLAAAVQPAGSGWIRLLQRVTPPGELAAECLRRFAALYPGASISDSTRDRDGVATFNRLRAGTHTAPARTGRGGGPHE